MNEEYDKKLEETKEIEEKEKIEEANEKITIEDILNAIKQENNNTNIQKELETYLRKITHLNEDELKVTNSAKSYLGLQLHNVDDPEVINILDQFMKQESKIEDYGDYLLIEYELD